MNQSIQNTKLKVLNAALELFSKKGYSAVSIRDICKVVGIKESTVYYHYKNKKDILDTLFARVEKLMEDMKDQFDRAFASTTQVKEDEFCMVAVAYLEHFFLEPTVYQLISMLTIEKLTDKQADQIYRGLMFEAPLKQQEKVFSMMIGKKYFKQTNAVLLANEYYSVMFYVFQKYFCGYEITDENKEQAREELILRMTDFYKVHKQEGELPQNDSLQGK